MMVIKEERPKNTLRFRFFPARLYKLSMCKARGEKSRMENKYSSHLLNKLQTYKINLKIKKANCKLELVNIECTDSRSDAAEKKYRYHAL